MFVHILSTVHCPLSTAATSPHELDHWLSTVYLPLVHCSIPSTTAQSSSPFSLRPPPVLPSSSRARLSSGSDSERSPALRRRPGRLAGPLQPGQAPPNATGGRSAQYGRSLIRPAAAAAAARRRPPPLPSPPLPPPVGRSRRRCPGELQKAEGGRRPAEGAAEQRGMTGRLDHGVPIGGGDGWGVSMWCGGAIDRVR